MSRLRELLAEIADGQTKFEPEGIELARKLAFQADAELLLAAERDGLLGKILVERNALRKRILVERILVISGLTAKGRDRLREE